MKRLADDGYDWFQRSAKGISAGDVFCIPLSSGYAFGRVMNAHDGATLAEFFRCWRAGAEFDESICPSGRLAAPIGILLDSTHFRNRKRSWKVIHSDAGYYPQDLYEIEFRQSLDGENWTTYSLADEKKVLRAVPAEDALTFKVGELPPQHPGRIARLLEDRLSEIRLMPAPLRGA